MKQFREVVAGIVIPVAPFTGAGIETFAVIHEPPLYLVAPFTGAWIETTDKETEEEAGACRTLHGCVD